MDGASNEMTEIGAVLFTVGEGNLVALFPIVEQEHGHFGALRKEHIGGADADCAVVDAGGSGDHSYVKRDVIGLNVQPNRIEGLRVGPKGAVIG